MVSLGSEAAREAEPFTESLAGLFAYERVMSVPRHVRYSKRW